MISQVLQHFRHLDLAAATAEPLKNAGGFSGAQLWKIESGQQSYCLRRWPDGVNLQRLAKNHQVLAKVAIQGCEFVPVPFCVAVDLSSQTIERNCYEFPSLLIAQSGIWQLEPWMRGRADFFERPSKTRLRAAAQALARFHLAVDSSHPGEEDVCPAIVDRTSMLERLMQKEFHQIANHSRTYAPPHFASVIEHTEIGFKRLSRSMYERLKMCLQLRVRVTPVIRDVWHDHVLFSGDQVTGIVDYGAMRDDSRAVDVARMLGSFCENEASLWQDAIDAYRQISPLTDNELTLLPVLDQSTVLLSLVNWLRWLFVENRKFENAKDILPRMHHLCDRLRLWIEPIR